MKAKKEQPKDNTKAYVAILIVFVVGFLLWFFVISPMMKNNLKNHYRNNQPQTTSSPTFDYTRISIGAEESDWAKELSSCEKYNEGKNTAGEHSSYKCPHGDKFVHLLFGDGKLVSSDVLNF